MPLKFGGLQIAVSATVPGFPSPLQGGVSNLWNGLMEWNIS